MKSETGLGGIITTTKGWGNFYGITGGSTGTPKFYGDLNNVGNNRIALGSGGNWLIFGSTVSDGVRNGVFAGGTSFVIGDYSADEGSWKWTAYTFNGFRISN